jgi:hypothetical protein
MTTKLYKVHITADVWVVAKSELDAESHALSDWDVIRDAMDSWRATAIAATAHSLSRRDAECNPWIHDDLDDEVDHDRTVLEWAELNDEAAAQAKREAEFDARQLPLVAVEGRR